MKCQQCDRPVMFRFGDKGQPALCLDCSHKFLEIMNMEFLQNAAMFNLAVQQMDAIMPLGGSSPSLPISELAMAMKKPATLNNIVVTNSTVGVINTGDLAKIDAAITITKGSDVEAVGDTLKRLVQTVIEAKELSDSDKAQIVEVLQELSKQLIGEKKPSVMMALISAVEERAKGANAVLTLAATLAEGIRSLFS